MGNIVSDLGKDIQSVVDSVGKLVTDTAAAVSQLESMATGFSGGAKALAATADDATDFDSALKNAMSGAKSAASKLFKETWTSVDPAGSNDGVVQKYSPGGSVQCAADQITQSFKDWEIPADSTTVDELANTIASQISAQLGAAGTAQGHHSLNMNQQVDWAIAYGLFEIADNNQGLVYAFTAGLDSGF